MAWLDGLRAVAVLLVVYAHLSRYLLRPARAFSAEWLHAGPAGVMLFFLVSGYIVPASLERHGSLRRFWISRLGRLLPLYLVVVAVVVALGAAGLVPLDPRLPAHPVAAAVAHLTMLPFLLGEPLATPVLWTLTYEMAFYLLVTALFVVNLHRRSAVAAIVLAVVAVLMAPLTTGRLGSPVALAAVVLAAGLIASASERRVITVGGGLLLGVLAAALLLLNQDPSHVWDGLLIVAVMFTGTAIRRADQGQTGWWPPAVAAVVVAAALLHNWFAELVSLHALIPRYEARSVITLLVFGGGFALAMATRRWRTPGWLAWLGRISYSIYLIHYTLIELLAPVLTRLGNTLRGPAEIPAVVGYLGLVVGLAAVTHRWIEIPGQQLARRLQRNDQLPQTATAA
jgi:peptidoglycan/LPS O-acetylase OafA/YrhL